MENGQVTINKLGVTRCDEFEGHLLCFTQEEERLLQKSCLGAWRCGNVQKACWSKREFVQQKQVLKVRNRECSRKEDSFDFREVATRRLVAAELRRFSPDPVTVEPPDVFRQSTMSLKQKTSRRRVVSANRRSMMCAA